MLHDLWVRMPETPEQIADCMREYAEAGMDGCLGSSDATHVLMEKMEARLSNHHRGGKSKNPTRVFNITVNHRRRILYTSRGCPGR